MWSIVTVLAVWEYKEDNFKTMSNDALRVCKEGFEDHDTEPLHAFWSRRDVKNNYLPIVN
jgi:hypothetical protein